MRADTNRLARSSRLAAILLLAVSASSCKPMDDAMVMIFGRSMRSQPSFDPYENTRPPAEGSMPFAYGNLPPAPGSLNIGHAEPVGYDLPNFDQTGLDAVAAPLVNPVE